MLLWLAYTCTLQCANLLLDIAWCRCWLCTCAHGNMHDIVWIDAWCTLFEYFFSTRLAMSRLSMMFSIWAYLSYSTGDVWIEYAVLYLSVTLSMSSYSSWVFLCCSFWVCVTQFEYWKLLIFAYSFWDLHSQSRHRQLSIFFYSNWVVFVFSAAARDLAAHRR